MKREGAWGDAHGVWFAASVAHPGATPPAAGATSDGGVPVGSTPHEGVTPFDGPDDVHVSPFGGIVLAEDGDGEQHLVGWTEAAGAFPWPATRSTARRAARPRRAAR